MKHFISLKYFSPKQIYQFLHLTKAIKAKPSLYNSSLKNRHVGLLFEKSSLRTKTAFYLGMLELGGGAIYYTPQEVELGKREKISDVSQTLSRFLDAVVLRTFSHDTILEFVNFASIPVINGLSDLLHPSQVLADLFTMSEVKGEIKKLKVCYVGDGNNVCHSLMYAFSILGGSLYVVNPKKYAPKNKIVAEAKKIRASGAKIRLSSSVDEAVKGADVLYTDVWTSMGKEAESRQRKKIFRSFQINDKMIKLARKDCIVMHCLPAHRGEEITDSVIAGKNSVVFLQAENRLHAAKAILVSLLRGR
ncbi:MAG: ornithine carbamoyltransferase [Candidatus Omnitrophota bacterium]|nr:MAG: ornithine carbamoyltransferase [Candidatus Omnitrophota bacterium]